ncbi:MAG: hypothetical protein LAO51_01545 [Acidobacteriia bacterium]|nr:hypothetical protein [Terriglobia bacterium]
MPKRHRHPLTKHLRIIRQSLTAIDRSLGRVVALTNRAVRGASADRGPQKRKLKLSPKRRAELKLQGQYMGYVRRLKPRQKAQVKALRMEKGVRAAIEIARRMAKA